MLGKLTENLCAGQGKAIPINIKSGMLKRQKQDQKTKRLKQGNYLTMPLNLVKLLSQQIVLAAVKSGRLLDIIPITLNHLRLYGYAMNATEINRVWVIEFKRVEADHE